MLIWMTLQSPQRNTTLLYWCTADKTLSRLATRLPLDMNCGRYIKDASKISKDTLGYISAIMNNECIYSCLCFFFIDFGLLRTCECRLYDDCFYSNISLFREFLSGQCTYTNNDTWTPCCSLADWPTTSTTVISGEKIFGFLYFEGLMPYHSSSL